MEDYKYRELISPQNLFSDIEEVENFCKIREDGWREGLYKFLEICEFLELYEYCGIIKREIEKSSK